ncbi:MAG: hypothetical protein IIA89_12955 [Chloroflexi bacterium]|nr:hypothetical protein [Chloroflexota bacterium]
MNRWISRIMVVALTLVALSPRTVAMAGGKPKPFSFHSESKTASAKFSSVEAGVQIDVDIFVFDARTHFVEENEPVMLSESGVGVSIEQNIFGCIPFVLGCPPRSISVNTFFPSLADDDFLATAVSPGATWTLNTTVEVFDFATASSFDVVIDLIWKCTEAVERAVQHPEPEPGSSDGVDKGVTTFASCSAEASGSVSDGSTNFTPAPSVEARMATENLVEIEVSHP